MAAMTLIYHPENRPTDEQLKAIAITVAEQTGKGLFIHAADPGYLLTEPERKAVIEQLIRDVLNHTDVDVPVYQSGINELADQLVTGLAAYWSREGTREL